MFYTVYNMKKLTLFAIAIFLINVAPVSAVNLDDIVREISFFKTEQAVLGASATNVSGTIVTQEQRGSFLNTDKKKLILKDLKESQRPKQVLEQTIRFGSRGDEVKKLQIFLIAQGYLKSEPTGNYLGQTRAALLQFQKDRAIVGGDGMIVGPKTRLMVNSIINSETASVQ